jgi:hypothetical protein
LSIGELEEMRGKEIHQKIHKLLSMWKIIDIVNKFAYNEDINKQRSDSMAQTNIDIRVDENPKREFDGLCSDLGLTMTAAFREYPFLKRRNENDN